MKLSAKLICYHLQKSFSMHTSRLDTSPTLSCPSCFEKNTVLQDGRVYLITDPDFQLTFHHPKNILFLMIGKIYQNYELTQPNMCIIPEDIPVNIVFNRIQDIFILYDQWNQSLMDSRLRNASIQELLDLTASIIPNPMMLIGMDFTIIASRDWNLSDLSNSVLGSTENSWAIVDSLKQDPHYEEAFYKAGYFYYPGNGLTAPSLCVNTRNILFICGGAFPDLENIIKERLNKQASIGFYADLKDKYDDDPHVLEKVTVDDLRAFGMIPEFIGRLPIIFTLNGLTEDMLVKILKEPKNAILKQYKKLLALDEVKLEFEDGALHAIARKALERHTGARALRAILEEYMLDIMYEIPKDDNIGEVVITEGYIQGNGGPKILMRGQEIPALEG